MTNNEFSKIEKLVEEYRDTIKEVHDVRDSQNEKALRIKKFEKIYTFFDKLMKLLEKINERSLQIDTEVKLSNVYCFDNFTSVTEKITVSIYKSTLGTTVTFSTIDSLKKEKTLKVINYDRTEEENANNFVNMKNEQQTRLLIIIFENFDAIKQCVLESVADEIQNIIDCKKNTINNMKLCSK